jgi:hypothetical protein
MFVIQDVPHDNSCLFHSVARFTKHSGPELRKLVVQKCQEYKDSLFQGMTFQTWIEASEGPFDAYVKTIAKDTTWGGYIELFLLSLSLQRQIAVYVLDGQHRAKKLVHIGSSGDPIFLLYVQNNHYMALLKQK